MIDRDKIREQGIRIIDEFSEKLKGIPETRETHYVIDMKNVVRGDDKPVLQEGFRDKISRLAPKWDENHVVAEKGV